MNLKKLKQLRYIFIFLILIPLTSQAGIGGREVRVLLQGGNYSFSTKSKNKSASVSGIGAFSFGIEYCAFDDISVGASYNYLKSSGIGGDTSIGVDLAAKYYPLTSSGYKSYSNGNLEVDLTQLWRPYVGFGLRQREFVLVLTTNYFGYGFFGGIDYQFKKKYYLNAEVRQDFYFGGTDDATATMMNIMLGIGYQF